jgi:hypothetical protein
VHVRQEKELGTRDRRQGGFGVDRDKVATEDGTEEAALGRRCFIENIGNASLNKRIVQRKHLITPSSGALQAS